MFQNMNSGILDFVGFKINNRKRDLLFLLYYVCLYCKHGSLLLKTVFLIIFYYISVESCSPREAKNAENRLV